MKKSMLTKLITFAVVTALLVPAAVFAADINKHTF